MKQKKQTEKSKSLDALHFHIERIRHEIDSHVIATSVKNSFLLPLFVILFFISLYQTNNTARFTFWIIAVAIIIVDLFFATKHYIQITRRKKELEKLLEKKKEYM